MTALYIVPENYLRSAYRPPKQSLKRLQINLVYDLMEDGKWRTLKEIAKHVKAPTQSVSARLRDLRKKKYGGHTVLREQSDTKGVFLYKLIVK